MMLVVNISHMVNYVKQKIEGLILHTKQLHFKFKICSFNLSKQIILLFYNKTNVVRKRANFNDNTCQVRHPDGT